MDHRAFDIIIKLNDKRFGNHVVKNYFIFSRDGKMVRETRMHTQREVVPQGRTRPRAE